MKKLFCIILLITAALLTAASALADGVSLEEALAMVGQEGCHELIELNDDLLRLQFMNSPDYSFSEGKFIVVVRNAPLKKYETNTTPFADNYMGVDDGEPKTYLHAGYMAMIPEEKRAASVAEIGNVLMAESIYYMGAEITSMDGARDNDTVSDLALLLMMAGRSDEAEAMQRLEEEAAEEAAEATKYTAVFNGVSLVNLYSWEDGGSLNLHVNFHPHPEMRKNPEADDYWDAIIEAITLIQYAINDDMEGANAYLSDEAGYLDDALLESMIGMDALTLYTTCDEEIWRLAELMAAADGDPDTMEQYDKVIEARNLNALVFIAQTRSYNSVNNSTVDRVVFKQYTAQIDTDTLLDDLSETVEMMASEAIEWDLLLLLLHLYFME
ncbi:MAG: hypothetical protein E7327_00980 [Clostridiales bacterium]|nr:hypothetical protein [Clostridiales bacterium]